jgi:hypothetical protein
MDYSVSKLQAAVQWVIERLRGHGALPMSQLLEDAARQFDLGLQEQSELRHRFHA